MTHDRDCTRRLSNEPEGTVPDRGMDSYLVTNTKVPVTQVTGTKKAEQDPSQKVPLIKIFRNYYSKFPIQGFAENGTAGILPYPERRFVSKHFRMFD